MQIGVNAASFFLQMDLRGMLHVAPAMGAIPLPVDINTSMCIAQPGMGHAFQESGRVSVRN